MSGCRRFSLGRLSRALTRARSFASAQDDKPGRSLVIVDETVVTLLFASLRSAAHVADSFARLASSPINSVISGCCPHPRAPRAPRPLPGQGEGSRRAGEAARGRGKAPDGPVNTSTHQ